MIDGLAFGMGRVWIRRSKELVSEPLVESHALAAAIACTIKILYERSHQTACCVVIRCD